jgi:ribulose-5-phosphate 4-epimerase/fuculose-1-phosphate aldolase
MIWANKMLASADLGVLDATGEVSVRNPANPNHFFVIRNVAPGRATPADIVEDDLDCRAVGSNSEQRPEVYIHCAIYAARPDVTTIVHAHTPEVEAFSRSSVEVKPVANLAGFIGNGLTKFDIRGPGTAGVAIDSLAKGKKVAEALGSKSGVVLTNHGFVVVDRSLYTIVSRADDMKLNARMQLQAILLGGKITYVLPLPGAAGSAPAPTVPLPTSVGGVGGGTSLDRAWEYWRYLLAASM